MPVSDVADSGSTERADAVPPVSGPLPTTLPNSPPTGGPMDNNIADGNGRGEDGAGNRLELAKPGMDPTAERILISVGSIGMINISDRMALVARG